MKTKYFVLAFLILFLVGYFASFCFAQSNRCVVMEKQGSVVTVTCAGEGTKVINMGGSADIYKPGDPITITEQTGTSKVHEVRPGAR